MKITAICAPSGPDFGLNAAFAVVCDTLAELGEDVQAVDLSTAELTYYNGGVSDIAHELMEGLKNADGLIFACSAAFHAPAALLHTFLEYFQDPKYHDLIKQKNCLLLSISQDGGERAAAEQLSRILGTLGAIDVVRISLDVVMADTASPHVIELIERQTEDFYRIIRQKRKYFLPLPERRKTERATDPQKNIIQPMPELEQSEIEVLYEKHELDSINESAQLDISKIAAMFTKKFVPSESENVAIILDDNVAALPPMPATKPATAPATKSCKQLTASLPHYFNAQLAKGLNAVIELDIFGSDGFSGYITISGQSCAFHDGSAAKNDIIVTADTAAWTDILNKKISAQKAFMMGKLKVRGNFQLLGKFDQLFNEVT